MSTAVQTVPRQLFTHHHNSCSFFIMKEIYKLYRYLPYGGITGREMSRPHLAANALQRKCSFTNKSMVHSGNGSLEDRHRHGT